MTDLKQSTQIFDKGQRAAPNLPQVPSCLCSLVLQGLPIAQQQKYIELFLVADHRAVRQTRKFHMTLVKFCPADDSLTV